ncbi:hypothetical protein FH608_041690 [Nonomuraea phyllanthi]|uniref:Uncharacterized protein n=1 Tax=Nonomuraea phyllanthi TaxID=2219224 RepID=A0A5C4VHJ2_9ACTN|nr:hypothetical protein [Nonomuraea phyllanthi]KAB8188996.1 hypothetical protein FH608_041690 [Nonomuraea phyllanthi]
MTLLKDVRGPWRIIQQGGTVLDVNVFNQDKGGFIEGTIKHGNNTVNIEDARVTQTQITFRAPWSPNSKGRYTGHFDIQGHIQGITFDELNTGVQATWTTPGTPFGDVDF